MPACNTQTFLRRTPGYNADAAKDGGDPSPVTAGIFIINRVTGFAGLSENQKVLCVAALAELATTIAPVVAAGTWVLFLKGT
jgi:hypothetical protein